MRAFIFIIAAVFGLGWSAASDEAQAAEEWGIEGEKVTRITVKVVDVLCELTGECPANCGGGKRQLGFVTDKGKLILAVKNNDPFAGATDDLIEFCGKKIVADGLLITHPKMTLFQLQFKRLAPDGKWAGATWFVRNWAKRHSVAGDSKKAEAWYNHDELIKATIAKDGVFGIPGLKPEKE